MCFDGGTYIGVSTIGKTWKVVAFERAPVRYTLKRGFGGECIPGTMARTLSPEEGHKENTP